MRLHVLGLTIAVLAAVAEVSMLRCTLSLLCALVSAR